MCGRPWRAVRPTNAPARARVRIRRPLPRQVRQEQHAVASRRHLSRLVDERRERHAGSERVAEPRRLPAADSITPMTCHRSGTAWQNACSLPSGSIERRRRSRRTRPPRCRARATPRRARPRPRRPRRRPGRRRPPPPACPPRSPVASAASAEIEPGDVRALVRRRQPRRGRCPARPATSLDQSRAARSNSSVPAPSACRRRGPPSVAAGRSPSAAACARSRDQTSGSWRRTHMSFGAVKPVSASLPVIAIRRSRPIVSRISSHSASVRWSFHRIAGRRTSS